MSGTLGPDVDVRGKSGSGSRESTCASERTPRYYEEQGLLDAERTASGERRYPPGAVDRVRFIQSLYAAGLGSRAVLRILPCMDRGVLTDEMHDRLLAERARVQAQLDQLTATRDKLDDVIRVGQAHRPGRRHHAGSEACA